MNVFVVTGSRTTVEGTLHAGEAHAAPTNSVTTSSCDLVFLPSVLRHERVRSDGVANVFVVTESRTTLETRLHAVEAHAARTNFVTILSCNLVFRLCVLCHEHCAMSHAHSARRHAHSLKILINPLSCDLVFVLCVLCHEQCAMPHA